MTEKNLQNYWKKVNVEGPLPDQSNPHYAGLDRCWQWTASVNSDGYGTFGVSKRTLGSHRVAWTLSCGQIPDGSHVIHKCDNCGCVNPSHLTLGSHTHNMQDKKLKGRSNLPTGLRTGRYTCPETTARGDRHGTRTKPEKIPRGERSGNAKLTDALVVEIRAAYQKGITSYREVGLRYGTALSNVKRIVDRTAWAHVP